MTNDVFMTNDVLMPNDVWDKRNVGQKSVGHMKCRTHIFLSLQDKWCVGQMIVGKIIVGQMT